jgi:hypothetical protein
MKHKSKNVQGSGVTLWSGWDRLSGLPCLSTDKVM